MPHCRRALTCLALAAWGIFVALCWVPASAAPPALLLAQVYRPGMDLQDYWVSEKYDGVRGYWDGSALRTRGGETVNAPAWFTAGWPTTALDGELWAGRGQFAQAQSTTRRDNAGDAAWQQIQWDEHPRPLISAAQCAKVARQDVALETSTGAFTMKPTTIGIDLAKQFFQVHAVNELGKKLFNKQLRRKQMAEFFVNLPPCLIGMEACGSAHHWARKLTSMGHTVKLMAPQFVKPYVKTNKNDAADAEAICEAVSRPNMRFVPIKNVEQQAVLALHRARQGFVKARTAQANQIRGLLAEFGIAIAQGISHIVHDVPDLIEDATNELPGAFRLLVQRLLDHFKELDKQVDELEAQIVAWHRQSEDSKRLDQIPGIGPLTASALIASLGDAKSFDNGRQVAAWLGLVPKQHSSGGKQNLLGISKRGDCYLRTLLIHGARSVIHHASKRADSTCWVNQVVQRRNKNVAAVALANKNARTVWALLAHDRQYQAGYVSAKAAA